MAENSQFPKQLTLTGDLAPETIGFRLSIEDRKLLHTHALQAGVSPHALARALVEQILRSGGNLTALLEVHEELTELRVELSKVKKSIAVSTAVLLVSAGRSSAEAAKDWVEKNIIGK